VPIALIPLVAEQGQVQDYSFVKGEPLATRVFAQVPKQWLVGYDAPVEAATVAVAALLGALGIGLAIRWARGRERSAVRIGAGAGLASLAIALVLALAGGDYYLSRYVLAAWLPIVLVMAVGFGAVRSGRLGLAATGALCALGVFVVLSVNSRPELQRDDWRGVADALGRSTGGARAIIVSPINGSIPLGLYLPLRDMGGGADVTELDAVAVAPRATGETRRAPAVRVKGSPPIGYTEMSRYQGPTYTVVRYRLDGEVRLTPELIANFALLGGTPDYVVEPAP
jgi:hypothetical protein